MADDGWLAAILCCSQKSTDYQDESRFERHPAPVQRNRPKLVPRELSGEAFQASVASVAGPKSTPWRVTYPEGILLRRLPNDFSAQTDVVLPCGECFLVAEALSGNEGVLFLRLADGRGWAFDRKPGVGAVAQRVHRGTVCSPGDMATQRSLPTLPRTLIAPRSAGFPAAAMQVSPATSSCAVRSTGDAALPTLPRAMPMSRSTGVNMTIDEIIAIPRATPRLPHATCSADNLAAPAPLSPQTLATSADLSRGTTTAAQSISLTSSSSASTLGPTGNLPDATQFFSPVLSRSAHARSTLTYSTLDEIRPTPLSSPTLPIPANGTLPIPTVVYASVNEIVARPLSSSILPASADAKCFADNSVAAAPPSTPILPSSADAERLTVVNMSADKIKATPLSSPVSALPSSPALVVYSSVDEIRPTPLSSRTSPTSAHATCSADNSTAATPPSSAALLAYTSFHEIREKPLSEPKCPTPASAHATSLEDNSIAATPPSSSALVVYTAFDEIRPETFSAPAFSTSEQAVCSTDDSISVDAFVDSLTEEEKLLMLARARALAYKLEDAKTLSARTTSVSAAFIAGDLVRVAPSVTTPRYGWSKIQPGDIGRVRSACSDDVISIDFNCCEDWLAHPLDLELVVREGVREGALSSDGGQSVQASLRSTRSERDGEVRTQEAAVNPLNLTLRVQDLEALRARHMGTSAASSRMTCSSCAQELNSADSGGELAARRELAVVEATAETIRYADGSEYTGATVEGRRHGEGSWHADAAQYEGQWAHDRMHGRGTHSWSDGRVYVGSFVDGRLAGEGRMVWKTMGSRMAYEGQYADDMKHGRGKFTWADGRSYDGEWRSGKRSGRGVYTTAKGVQSSGVWVDNRLKEWVEEVREMCPSGHALTEFTTDSDDLECDVCGADLPRGSEALGCRMCDWDCCMECQTIRKAECPFDCDTSVTLNG